MLRSAHEAALADATKFEELTARLGGVLDLADVDAAAEQAAAMAQTVANYEELKTQLEQLQARGPPPPCRPLRFQRTAQTDGPTWRRFNCPASATYALRRRSATGSTWRRRTR